MIKNFKYILVTLLAIFAITSCDRQDPNRNYYEVGTKINRQIMFEFLGPEEFEEKCYNLTYQGKNFARADACATESGEVRRVYMKERPDVCTENGLCLTGQIWKNLSVVFIEWAGPECGGKPICIKNGVLYTYQYNPMSKDQMKKVGQVLSEYFQFPDMYNDSDELGHEIYSHVLNMGGTH